MTPIAPYPLLTSLTLDGRTQGSLSASAAATVSTGRRQPRRDAITSIFPTPGSNGRAVRWRPERQAGRRGMEGRGRAKREGLGEEKRGGVGAGSEADNLSAKTRQWWMAGRQEMQ